MGTLKTPDKVQRLKNVLYEKAKSEPNFRFYSLYDKLYRPDVLEFAYRQSKANRGSPGADGVTFQQVEEEGREQWLGALAKDLREGTYTPGAVRRIYIEKANGKLRPLGIPNLRDRVVQTAATIVLGSIFEADFTPEQYAYRENRSAKDAIEKVNSLLNAKRRHSGVVDADLSSYFDIIPHPELMRMLSRRIADGKVLHLLKMWLEMPVEEKDKKTGHVSRTTHNKDKRIGTPQGAVISPLYSNVYMREFLVLWENRGKRTNYGAIVVNYADDMVICGRTEARYPLDEMKKLMKELKLTVNEEKTRCCDYPDVNFTFLGYEFKHLYSFKKRKWYLGHAPSDKAVKKITDEVHDLTSRKFGWMETSEMAKKINSMVRGWANYFQSGAVSKAYRRVSRHVKGRFRQWLARKFKWNSKHYNSMSDPQMCELYGLVDIMSLVPKYS